MPGGGFEPAGVRPAAVAGSWYPSDAPHLTSQLEVMLEAAGPWTGTGRLRAMVAPHAALMYSGPTAAYGYACVQADAFDRVLMLAPNHRATLRGAVVDPSAQYETPLGRMPVDLEAVEALASQPAFACNAKPFAAEHAIEMQLPFAQLRMPGATLVPVLVGEVREDDLDALASALSPLLVERTLLVVTSDFVHYGPNYHYVPFTERVPERIRNLDRQSIDAIENHDLERFQSMLQRTGATICGRNALAVFLALGRRIWKSELRHYTTSGEITGDYSNSVSYACIIFCEGQTEPQKLAAEAEKLVAESAESAIPDLEASPPATTKLGEPTRLLHGERRTLLAVARRALAELFAPPGLAPPGAADVTSALREPRGVFVTLRRRRSGRLRGCIGSLEPRLPLLEAVALAARDAAQHDPRFRPLRRDELEDVGIEISVLGPVLPVGDASEILVGRDGVVVTQGLQRGLLLPQVPADMGWDRAEFLENVCRKAGLPPDAWRQGAVLERFEAEVFSETEVADAS